MRNDMGARIRELRLKNNFTLEELSSELELTPGFLGLVERGYRGTTIENIGKICEIFNVTFDYLIFGKGKQLVYDDMDYNEILRGHLVEEQRDFIIKTVGVITKYRLTTGEDLSFVLKALEFLAKHQNEIKRQYRKEPTE